MVTVAGIVMIMLVLGIPTMLLMVISMWRIYQKAGFGGWECIVPIYSALVLLKIVGKPWYWILIYFILPVNLVFIVWSCNMLSKSFGKDEGFTAGLLFLGFIFFPMLGLGSAQYQGPYGNPVLYKAYRNRNNPGFDFETEKLG